MLRQQRSCTKGRNNMVLPVAKLAKGAYLLLLASNGVVERQNWYLSNEMP